MPEDNNSYEQDKQKNCCEVTNENYRAFLKHTLVVHKSTRETIYGTTYVQGDDVANALEQKTRFEYFLESLFALKEKVREKFQELLDRSCKKTCCKEASDTIRGAASGAILLIQVAIQNPLFNFNDQSKKYTTSYLDEFVKDADASIRTTLCRKCRRRC